MVAGRHRPAGVVDRRLFVLVGTMVLVENLFYSVLIPLLPFYVGELGLTKASAGTLSAFYAFAMIAFAVPAGFLVARIGARRTVLTGVALLAVSSIAFGFARDLELLDAARFLQGAGGACVWAAGLTWLVSTAPRQRRGELVGAAVGVGIAGALLGPVLGGIATVTSPELVFSAVAAVIAALGFLALRIPAPPPGRPDTLGDLVRAARAEPSLRAGLWFTALPSTLFGVLEVLAPLRLSALGAGSVAIALTFFVCTAVEAAINPVVGRLADRRGAYPVARAGLAACAVVAVILPLPGAVVPYAVLLVGACVAFGAPWVPAGALLSGGVERRGLDLGVAFGLWNLAWGGGQAVGAAGGAGIAEASSDAVPYLIGAALCLLTVLGGAVRSRRAAGRAAGAG
ncbi:MAG: MFS transporter [Solirubrobacterales bacterium]